MSRAAVVVAVAALALGVAPPSPGIDFQPFQRYPTGSWPIGVAIGDVTSDARNDVLLVTSSHFDPENDYKLFFFEQEPNGTLGSPLRLTPIGWPGPPAVGDLTGDGAMDVALPTYHYGVNIFPQQGGVLGAPYLVPGTGHSDQVVTYDVNRDGLLDMVVGLNDLGVAVAINTGVGFEIRAVTSTWQEEIEAGDVTGDGLVDVVGRQNDVLHVYPQRPDGTFGPPDVYDLNEIWSEGIETADVTGDGCTDVVVAIIGSGGNSHVDVFRQNSTGRFDPRRAYPSHSFPEPVEALDMDRDGRLDVVTLGSWAAGLYLQTSSGEFDAERLFPIPDASHYSGMAVALGDFSGDEAPDIAVAHSTAGLVVLRQVTPNPQPPPPPAAPACPWTPQPPPPAPPPPTPPPPPQPPPPPPAPQPPPPHPVPPPPPPARCRVPRVVGLRLGAARRRLLRANCSLGRVRRMRSVRIGRVLAQSPPPGTVRRRGFPVKVVLGRR
jgi:hypothetical protein